MAKVRTSTTKAASTLNIHARSIILRTQVQINSLSLYKTRKDLINFFILLYIRYFIKQFSLKQISWE